ncbi:MAG: 6-bladed beta-propeller [Gemmatimonadetes bacterium]|nr:6-bladed beta-propeller [Gemmatimonadota bacterium]
MWQLRVSPSWRGLALTMLLPLAGCAEGGGEWQGSVTDSAGVRIVTNTGGGLWAPSAGWTVEEDLRIGSAEGEAEYQFGQIAGIDVASDGRIFILDQQARDVRVFDQDGRFIARMGKAGSGPGELGQGAGPVFVGPGDTVSVPDVGQQRVTRYTAAGEPAGSFPVSMADGIAVKWMEAPDGDLVQQAMIMALPNQPSVEPRNLLLRRDPRGEITDTLMIMPAGQTMDFSGGQPRMTLFAPEPMWAVGPQGHLVYGNNSVYRLEIFGPGGELERVISKDRERNPITETDQEEFRRAIREAWEQAGMPPQAMDMMGQALRFAEYYPAYANLFGGPAGSVWVQSVQSPEDVRESGATFDLQDIGGPEWEIFDAEGRLLGVVRMPPRFTPLLFRDDHIYGVLRDDLDIQYATRMRVSRPEIQQAASD